MKPLYIASGETRVAAIYQPSTGAGTGTMVLLVPPLGWDDQTSYRPRRDWSRALAQSGFANVRIDFPGSGDSSGTPRDPGLLDSWSDAVASAIAWLRALNPDRVAVIALGAGGLVTLKAMAQGAKVDDLVLWGTPADGRALLREFKAFGRLEQPQTGELPSDTPDGELRAGGHVLAAPTVAALCTLDGAALAAAAKPTRALLLGRDGRGPESALVEALRAAGAAVASDAGRGWGAALARPQSVSPLAIFELVNLWLAQEAKPGAPADPTEVLERAELGPAGARIRETPILFEAHGKQLYAILAEPLDAPLSDGTVILFNAGAIRRIGPNRMWTEAARRWASGGVPVLRVDLEGIGDADGDAGCYRDSDEPFYTEALVDQARSTLDLAIGRGLPGKFLLAGLCGGAFWAFQAALADPRVQAVAALNPRMLIFDADVEGQRELRRLSRIVTIAGFRRMLLQERKLDRLARLVRFMLATPLRLVRKGPRSAGDRLLDAVRTMHARGQSVDIAFCGDEPLDLELRADGRSDLQQSGVRFHELPCKSHTLKPLAAQQAGHAILDEIVERRLLGSAAAANPPIEQARAWTGRN